MLFSGLVERALDADPGQRRGDAEATQESAAVINMDQNSSNIPVARRYLSFGSRPLNPARWSLGHKDLLEAGAYGSC